MTKFNMGQLVITPTALDALKGQNPAPFLRRHLAGDWGDLSNNDKRENGP